MLFSLIKLGLAKLCAWVRPCISLWASWLHPRFTGWSRKVHWAWDMFIWLWRIFKLRVSLWTGLGLGWSWILVVLVLACNLFILLFKELSSVTGTLTAAIVITGIIVAEFWNLSWCNLIFCEEFLRWPNCYFIWFTLSHFETLYTWKTFSGDFELINFC